MKIKIYSRGETDIDADREYQEPAIREAIEDGCNDVPSAIIDYTDNERSNISHDEYAIVSDPDGTELWRGWLSGDQAEPAPDGGAPRVTATPGQAAASAIYVFDGGDFYRLECWAGTRNDMAAVVAICDITPSQTWEELTAKVAEHQAKHGCGAATAERDALREAVRKLHALFGEPDSHGVVHAVTTRKTLEAAAQAAVAAQEPHAAAGKTPGQLASIAFRVTAFAEADDTSAVLAWDELPQNYRDGWEAAAQAVLNQAFPGLREQMRLARADRDQLRKQVLDLAAELETSAARTVPSKKTDIENAAAAKLRKAAEPPS